MNFYVLTRMFVFSREIALEVLEQEPVGSFMVRESTSKPGCFALSLRVPRDFHQSGIAHYLIMRTNRGYKIKVKICYFVSRLYINSIININNRL